MKITERDGKVSRIEFVENTGARFTYTGSAVLEQTVRELTEYFSGKRTMFTVPTSQEGTPFQQSVWKALTEIPYGETRSYGELAKSLNNEKAVRAVGAANGKNKIPILIPCHRVIGFNNKPVGFAYGLERKIYLLNHERNHSTVTAQLSF